MAVPSPPSAHAPPGTPAIPTVSVLGMPVAQLPLPDVLEYIRSGVRNADADRRTRLITYANAHTCNLFIENDQYRHALRQVDLIYVDGNGPRFAAWLAGSWLPKRMTGADWIYDLCHLCAREGFRLYLLGSGQGVAEEAARRLNSQIPGLSVVGAQSGYFAQDEEGRVLQAIHAATPDILVLGIGTPRQEIWMTRMKELLEVPVVWGAGGVFDYASGRLSRPPWWMRKLALEWLGRMMIEPRRLALRYLLGIPVFLVRSLVHVFSGQPQRLSS